MVRALVLSHAQLTAKAEAFLCRYHAAGTFPVPMEAIVEFGLRLELVPQPRLRELVRVDAFVTRDGRQLWLDAEDFDADLPYLRFTYAEEAGHLDLHADIMRAVPVASDQDWLELRRQVEADPTFERQAKTFAGLVLVPTAALRRECDLVCRVVARELKLLGADGPEAIRGRIVAQLAGRFGVHARVIEIRMGRCGFWERVERQLGRGVGRPRPAVTENEKEKARQPGGAGVGPQN